MFHEVHERRLDNGLTVLLVPNRTSPTASFQVWYRVGSRNERTGVTGISHIFEHMMFKGTHRFPKGEFDRLLQENGMSYNAFTSHDYTAYFEVMASDRLELAVELEADRMQGLVLDSKEFSSEMAVIREERRQTREDPPFGLLNEAVEAATFTAHPYHWPVIGWMTDLHTITLQDVHAYYADRYRPNNAIAVAVGDLDPESALAVIETHFGAIPAGPDLPEITIVEPEARGERTVSVHKEVQLPGLLLSYRAPDAAAPDSKALHLIETLLFDGRSSRLYQKLIYRNQLAVSLAGGLHLRKDPSTFVVQAMARPGVEIGTLRDAIYEELDRLGREPVSPAELEKAFRTLEADYVFGQESNVEIGQDLGRYACLGSWRDHHTYLEDHQKVTAEDIVRVASETFRSRSRTVGYLVPDLTGVSASVTSGAPARGTSAPGGSTSSASSVSRSPDAGSDTLSPGGMTA